MHYDQKMDVLAAIFKRFLRDESNYRVVQRDPGSTFDAEGARVVKFDFLADGRVQISEEDFEVLKSLGHIGTL